LKKIISRKIY